MALTKTAQMMESMRVNRTPRRDTLDLDDGILSTGYQAKEKRTKAAWQPKHSNRIWGSKSTVKRCKDCESIILGAKCSFCK